MNCIWILLLLCCCGNNGFGNGCSGNNGCNNVCSNNLGDDVCRNKTDCNKVCVEPRYEHHHEHHHDNCCDDAYSQRTERPIPPLRTDYAPYGCGERKCETCGCEAE